eukprot:6234059-Heterocapsa_arctica.AAC.1
MRRSQGPTCRPREGHPAGHQTSTGHPACGGSAVHSASLDAEWELFCLDHDLEPSLAATQVYADEEFQGLRDDLQERQHRPRDHPDLFGVWAGL